MASMADVEFYESDQKGRSIVERRQKISETNSPVVRWTMYVTGFSQKHAKMATNALIVIFLVTAISVASVYYYDRHAVEETPSDKTIELQDI